MSDRKLYMAHYVSDDGDNLDLFVWANDPDEVAKHWREYYDQEVTFHIGAGWKRMGEDFDYLGVTEVPVTGMIGAVSWDVLATVWLPMEWD